MPSIGSIAKSILPELKELPAKWAKDPQDERGRVGADVIRSIEAAP
jgi:hypothetical protein